MRSSYLAITEKQHRSDSVTCCSRFLCVVKTKVKQWLNSIRRFIYMYFEFWVRANKFNLQKTS